MEPVFLTLEGTLVVWNYINVMVILPAALLVLEQLGVSNARLFAWKKHKASIQNSMLYFASKSGWHVEQGCS